MHTVESTIDQFKSSPDYAAVQQRSDENVGIEAMIEELRNISTVNKEQQIELQAGIAYLSLFSESISFAAEAKLTLELIDESDIKRLAAPLQVILLLANNAGIVEVAESKTVKITQRNSDIVNSLCGRGGGAKLGRRNDDIRELGANFYKWKMSQACRALIRDQASPDIARHLAVVPVAVDSNQLCLFVQKRRVISLVAAWLTCELRQEGIDMNALLETIRNRHRDMYENALLEAAMLFPYPDELLTAHQKFSE